MVLESVLFGLLAALGIGVADFIAVLAVRRIGVLATALGAHVAAVGVTTIYLVVAATLSGVSSGQWAVLAAIAVLTLFTYLGFFKALQLGPVAIVSPISATYAVVVILLAFLLEGERLTAGQAGGVAASIGGIVLASVNFRGLRPGAGLMSKGVLFGILAMLGLGVFQYTIGTLSKDMGWFLPVYLVRLFMLSILAPVYVARRGWTPRRLTVPAISGVALVGVFETLGLFAFTRGAEVGIISIVAAASTCYPMVPIMGGLFLFRERLAPIQVLGLAAALGGLLLLALSG